MLPTSESGTSKAVAVSLHVATRCLRATAVTWVCGREFQKTAGCTAEFASHHARSRPTNFEAGLIQGGSVKIDNLPTPIDIAVPFSGRNGGGSNGATRCKHPIITQARPYYLNCYSRSTLGTGLWIHCSQALSAQQCLNGGSHGKRLTETDETFDISQFGEQGHPGFIDEEEAALPPISYHAIDGSLISSEEFRRWQEREKAHEANGTLHHLYPEHYDADYMLSYHNESTEFEETSPSIQGSQDSKPQEAEEPEHQTGPVTPRLRTRQRLDVFEVAVFVDVQCRGAKLATMTEYNKCYTTDNGASLVVERLPKECYVHGYSGPHCKGPGNLAVGQGAGDGCYDIDSFNSARIICIVG